MHFLKVKKKQKLEIPLTTCHELNTNYTIIIVY